MDSTLIRILVATQEEFIIINPNWTIKGDYENLDSKHIKRIPLDKVDIFQVLQDSRIAKISWSIEGKNEIWVVDIANPSVWHFNPQNLQNIINISSNKGA